MSIQIVRDVISDVVFDSLETADRDYSDRFADKCIKRLSEECRGTYVYIPASIIDKSDRDRQIKEEFNGKNIKKLSRKHKLSVIRIYQIINDKN